MRIAIAALIGALTLTSVPELAAAQTAGDRADIRCILVLGAVARDPKQKDAATQGTFYFWGHLDAHNLGAKLDPTMLAEGAAMNDQAKIQAELNRCGGELQARSAALRATYTRLQEATKTAPAPPTK